MSKVSKSQQDSLTTEFVGITGATIKDANVYLKKHNWRLDIAIDAFYNNPPPVVANSSSSRPPDVKKITQLFEEYKEDDGDEIGVTGTIKMCKALGINPEDVSMLAVAYELKSPGICQWTREGWVEGWKKLNADTTEKMAAAISELGKKLNNNTEYLQAVYNFTFGFAKTEVGQRSIAVETAIEFWRLLLPAGLKGTALRHVDAKTEDGGETITYVPSREPGWKLEYNDLWFEYMQSKGGKGVSKDTWQMFFDFVRTIDAKFEKHDVDAAWPSAIDDFAEWAKERVAAL